jgi:hypothetical protein
VAATAEQGLRKKCKKWLLTLKELKLASIWCQPNAQKVNPFSNASNIHFLNAFFMRPE